MFWPKIPTDIILYGILNFGPFIGLNGSVTDKWTELKECLFPLIKNNSFDGLNFAMFEQTLSPQFFDFSLKVSSPVFDLSIVNM